jgi:RimJ/RimL family protein N-acetyltransferase
VTVAVPTLETERLRLRPWRNGDVEPLAELFGDEQLARFIGGITSRRDTWRRLASFAGHWQLRGFGNWAVEEKTTGDFCGFCGLWFPIEFPEIEAGWALLSNKHGKGFATEAAARARAFAFEDLKLPTLVSFIVAENLASQRVAQRLGAVPDGETEIQGKTVTIWRHPTPKH